MAFTKLLLLISLKFYKLPITSVWNSLPQHVTFFVAIFSPILKYHLFSILYPTS